MLNSTNSACNAGILPNYAHLCPIMPKIPSKMPTIPGIFRLALRRGRAGGEVWARILSPTAKGDDYEMLGKMDLEEELTIMLVGRCRQTLSNPR